MVHAGTRRKPLSAAIYAGAPVDILRVLLDSGADMNSRDDNGNTALIDAACARYTEAVKLFLDRGADVNARSTEGGTALDCAKERDAREIVRILRRHGARR